ncbi:carbohydrate sulfotransferase 11-like [Pecten maximus]|uniref:carbohydrate sulfotransferase 11-like n=1 Tax=Pecten maximus TaxID=6579 RepID=UPI0014586116|nr:carbohydrate sulfotransferase 11-like [Pecten maximus]XP_033728686.1 carbohydrate sulfotransferase 11-like [Pecten maximus]
MKKSIIFRVLLKRGFILPLTAVLAIWYFGINTKVMNTRKFWGNHTTLSHLSEKKQIRWDSFEDRRNHLRKTCDSMPKFRQNGTLLSLKRKYLLYDSKHDFVFCMVQKIGCTFWRRVFHLLTQVNISDLYSIDHYKVHFENLPSLERLDINKMRRILHSATTAMFVREPYERAVSGYLDKLFAINSYYMETLGRQIVRMTRKNASVEALTCGHDVTFTEFIQYILKMKRQNNIQNIDHHFTPIYIHCSPCAVKYDFIGRMETFEEDTKAIFEKTGIFRNRTITMEMKDSIVDDIRNKFKEVFMARKALSHCMTLPEMYGRVWKTLQLRGIINPDIPMPSSRNVTLEVLHREAVEANDPSRVSEYKHRAFVNLYKTLDRKLLKEFREYVLPDCKLFGYNDRPSELFS